MIFPELNEKLKEINVELKNRLSVNISKAGLRKKLAENLGRFIKLKEMSAGQVLKQIAGRPVVAVDGSVNSVGSVFPYLIYLFQAMAKVTSGENIVLTRLLSPLIPTHYQELEREAGEMNMLPEQALPNKKDCTMTALELRAAIRSVQEHQPSLVLFDGGFARFERFAFPEWQEYQKMALAAGVLTVGVIEEAKSFGLAGELGLNNEQTPVYDREILFGLMRPGECFMPDFGRLVKKSGYYTAFARLSGAPQAVACDFLEQQSAQALDIMNCLFTLTPSGSRGIPILLDIVDAEVRLSHQELELLVNVSLDAEIREKFLMANRKRRDY